MIDRDYSDYHRGHESGVSAMAQSLRSVLDGAPCMLSEPPELAEVARLRATLKAVLDAVHEGRLVCGQTEAQGYIAALLESGEVALLGRPKEPVCGNCDTAMPDGCGGLFKRDGAACMLNAGPNVEVTGNDRREQS